MADLHVSNVPVDVHGGRDAVFRDVFVTIWTRFAVHRVNTGDGNSFVAKGYVTINTADGISFKDLKARMAETLLEKKKKKAADLSTPMHIVFHLCRIFSSALSMLILLPRSFLLACKTAQAFEVWLQQSGAVSPSRFFRNTLAPRFKKSLWRHVFFFLNIKTFHFKKKKN